MKAINKIFISLGVATGLLGATSCVNDLDLLPVDPNQTTAATFEEDPEGYMNAVLADVYLNFSTYGPNGSSTVTQFDGGMSTFQRGLFILEEIPTDEANWLPTGDVEYGVLQYGSIPSNSPIAGGIYSRLTINITLCNDFIKTVNDGLFHLNDALKVKAQEYVRQCKILRSACFYYLIDLYGNVPYADENTPVGSVSAQWKRADITRQVITDLENVVAEYGSGKQTPIYGFVGKEVAQALLVKFYLNAEVYTGAPMYDKCLAVANDIIAAHKGTGFKNSGLCVSYKQPFGANNDQYVLGGTSDVHEIIWGIVQNEPNLKSWAGATLMVNGFIGANPVAPAVCDLTRWHMSDGWKCMTARRQFVEKFDWNENYTYSPDARTDLWCTAADGFNINNDVLDQDHFGNNGFLPVKYSNWAYDAEGNIDEANSPNPNSQLANDYAMIRLAEIYLSAAEACLKGAGSRETALEYVNYIRERAQLDPWAITDVTLDNVFDERCRELYTECTRRTDLIRAGKWVSGYNWNWKGQVHDGVDLPAYSVLYPLPSAIVYANGYTQNPGY